MKKILTAVICVVFAVTCMSSCVAPAEQSSSSAPTKEAAMQIVDRYANDSESKSGYAVATSFSLSLVKVNW